MARYEHLPIWKTAFDLAHLLERAVRGFPGFITSIPMRFVMNRSASIRFPIGPLLVFLTLLSASSAQAAATCPTGNALSTPSGDFTVNGDGTVTHAKTGLTWKRCHEGWDWSGATCTDNAGVTDSYTWAAALAAATAANTAQYAGHADWRLPNKKELQSIVETGCYSPSINEAMFPGTPSSYFWSSTAYAAVPADAWGVVFSFGGGNSDANGKSDDLQARLVRGGQSFALFDAVAPDDDGDGQADALENAGPSPILGQSDGNGDGTPDSVQANIATLLRPDGGYVTVETDCPAGLTGVQTYTEASQGGGDAAFDLPYGLVGFSAACETAQFKVYYHGVASVAGMTYRKYGPTTPGNAGTTAWYTLSGVAFGSASVGAQTVATATFTLNDSALGDDTGNDGVIVDQGGVGNGAGGNGAGGAQAIPTLTGWGMLALSGVLGLLAWFGLKRQRG